MNFITYFMEKYPIYLQYYLTELIVPISCLTVKVHACKVIVVIATISLDVTNKYLESKLHKT